MVSKFNKNVLFALAAALLGVTVKAESGDVMNHRLVVKGIGGMHFGSGKDNFKAITKVDRDTTGVNWHAGGAIEYDYMFNPFIGVGLNVAGGYQSLWKFELAKPTENSTDNANKTTGTSSSSDNKNAVCFNGFFVTPTIRVVGNFLEDGFIYDEEEEGAAGFKAGAYLGVGSKFNFGKVDYSKITATIFDSGKNDKKMQPQLGLVSVFGELGFFCELPLGIGFETSVNFHLLDNLKPEEAAENNNTTGNATANASDVKKDGIFGVGFTGGIFYDLANFLA